MLEALRERVESIEQHIKAFLEQRPHLKVV